MPKFNSRIEAVKFYWLEIFDEGAAYECCMSMSVALLSMLYIIGLTWMVPASIIKAFRK